MRIPNCEFTSILKFSFVGLVSIWVLCTMADIRRALPQLAPNYKQPKFKISKHVISDLRCKQGARGKLDYKMHYPCGKGIVGAFSFAVHIKT